MHLVLQKNPAIKRKARRLAMPRKARWLAKPRKARRLAKRRKVRPRRLTKPRQAVLAMGDWVLGTAEGVAPREVSAVLSSVRRRVRKIRRSGERMSGAFRETLDQSTLTVASLLSRPLSLLGWQLKPLVEAASKKVLLEEDLIEVEAELCNAEICTFEELNLSDYDSDLDADYSPSEESSSEDELEFNTDAEVSSVVDDLELLA